MPLLGWVGGFEIWNYHFFDTMKSGIFGVGVLKIWNYHFFDTMKSGIFGQKSQYLVKFPKKIRMRRVFYLVFQYMSIILT